MSTVKTKFFQKECLWLDHKISADPISTKTEAFEKLQIPGTVSQVLSLMGKLQQFSRFIPQLTARTANIRKLQKKDEKFIWTERQDREFEDIKTSLTSMPVMAHFNNSYYTNIT